MIAMSCDVLQCAVMKYKTFSLNLCSIYKILLTPSHIIQDNSKAFRNGGASVEIPVFWLANWQLAGESRLLATAAFCVRIQTYLKNLYIARNPCIKNTKLKIYTKIVYKY